MMKKFHITIENIVKGNSGMNENERCRNCIYWQQRTCMVTGNIKNDGVCTCGQFKQRKEAK